MDYKSAGVDIEAGYKAVELMKEHVRTTMRPEVLGGLGGFSGEVGHHAHAAVVMLEFASVQSLRALLSIRLLDVFAVHVVFAFA